MIAHRGFPDAFRVRHHHRLPRLRFRSIADIDPHRPFHGHRLDAFLCQVGERLLHFPADHPGRHVGVDAACSAVAHALFHRDRMDARNILFGIRSYDIIARNKDHGRSIIADHIADQFIFRNDLVIEPHLHHGSVCIAVADNAL